MKTKLLIPTLYFILSFSFNLSAQQFLNNDTLKNKTTQKKPTFWDVQHAFESYWNNSKTYFDSLDFNSTDGENPEKWGYNQYKRWENFTKQRTYPTGEFPNPEILFNEYQKYKSNIANNKYVQTQAANWSFMGPSVVPGNGGGAGRLNCIAIDPNNPSIMWVGAACGGLWKTNNGGITWSSNTDLLPSLSISDIVIDPTNNQIMYLATGDKYGIYYQYQIWGHYSAGVLKSTDGGVTWNPTGMNYTLANNALIQRLIIDPSNTNILYAATFSGIYKTTNGGTTWTNIANGQFYDIEFKPGTPTTLYASNINSFIYSTNSGNTWTNGTGVTGNGRTSIAVSAANTSLVYFWSENGGFYASTNSGVSFTARTNPSSSCTPYGHYDMTLEVSQTNANTIFTGGLNIALSTNGGTSWTTVSSWSSWPSPNYAHADHHALQFLPGSSSTIFACNDGGIFKSTNTGSSWTDLSNGIHIKQYYRMSGSQQNANLFLGGAQDNGTDKVTNPNTATQIYGADGEDCLIDFTNDQIMFYSYQGGNFYRSTNGGNTSNAVSASGCDWTSPIIMDPTNHNIVYIGGTNVFKSSDNGITWTNISAGYFDGTCIYSMRQCSTQVNNMYVATFGNIYKTTNGGNTWTTITGTLPVGSLAITGIAVSNVNPNLVWVTFSGFQAANKVYFSSNGGTTWTNISSNLPNVPANCIEFQNGSNDLVYLGTDLGVFYTDASMNNWMPYNTGLPNVIIDDLEIHYPTSKLRTATFGRGVWQTDLQVSTLQNLDASAMSAQQPPSQTCDTLITPVITIRNAGVTTLTTVDVYYKMDAQSYQVYNYVGSLPSLATANITLPTYNLTPGVHSIKAYTTNPNSGTDQNNFNDTLTYSFTIIGNSSGQTPPVQEGFISNNFPPNNWQLENSSTIWSRSATVGGYSLSTNSARASFYSISSGIDEIITQPIDFSNTIAPITMYFDVAHATYSSTYKDSLFIEFFDDCNNIPYRLYTKGYLSLATAPPTTSPFVPTSTQWRTDTIHLDSLAGRGSLKFRFMAKSGWGNDMYLDNINITGGLTSILSNNNEHNLILFPNPTNELLNVQYISANTTEKTFIVMDATGKIITQQQVWPTNKTTTCTINTTSYNAGIYLLLINDGANVISKKFTVIK